AGPITRPRRPSPARGARHSPEAPVTRPRRQTPARGAARGAHAMVHIPDTAGETSGGVLVIGGMKRIRMDAQRAFPFVLGADKTDVLNDVLLYDIDANTWDSLSGVTMAAKRAFPQAGLMSDGTVSITGGGGWPDEADDLYRQIELFDPLGAEGPGFVATFSFEGAATRSGHTMTSLGDDESGQSQYLLWGGTSDISHSAEVLRQSSLQREGVDGYVAPVAEGGNEAPFSTYFHQLTPLSDSLEGDRRFLLTGGVTASGEGLSLPGLSLPREEEAWVLTYAAGPSPTLTVIRAPGFGVGRIFHTAASSDGQHLSVVGGFTSVTCGVDCTGYELPAVGGIRLYDDATGAWSEAPESDAFTARGGMGGQMMSSGRVLTVGGEPDLWQFSAPSQAMVELYTPSNTPTP
ncbi:MAG: hypothetical protein QF464_20315, partial [Myxococcota bacterium]|nr:hypothetical protein [Myxococcota bacterium]